MKNFNYWKKLHDSEQLSEFSTDTIGLLWLKTKSILRKELITEFTIANSITLKETTLGKQFVELFELLCKNATHSHQILDTYCTENLAEVWGDELEVNTKMPIMHNLFNSIN